MKKFFEQVRATVRELQVGARSPDMPDRQVDLIQALVELDANLAAMEPTIRDRDHALVRSGIVFAQGMAKTLSPEASISRPYLDKLVAETDENLTR